MRIKFIQNTIDKLRGKTKIDVSNPKLAFNEKFIYCNEDAEDIISKMILNENPVLISRFGTVELETVRQFLVNGSKKEIFDQYQKDYMESTPGFFPADDYNMAKFACEQIEVTKQVDILGVRVEKFEEQMCNRYLKEPAKLVHINHLSYPTKWENSWTKHLKGKKVLVIHPFEESIKKQYAKRELLHDNKEMLPDFELITLKPAQGIGDSKYALPYKDWFEALDDMKKQITNIDFDIALIGAGAYGMFLGAHCKDMGKKAIHMGGALQLIFGIKGKRWDSCGLYNEYWVRPTSEETPKGVEKFEHGTFAYW